MAARQERGSLSPARPPTAKLACHKRASYTGQPWSRSGTSGQHGSPLSCTASRHPSAPPGTVPSSLPRSTPFARDLPEHHGPHSSQHSMRWLVCAPSRASSPRLDCPSGTRDWAGAALHVILVLKALSGAGGHVCTPEQRRLHAGWCGRFQGRRRSRGLVQAPEPWRRQGPLAHAGRRGSGQCA